MRDPVFPLVSRVAPPIRGKEGSGDRAYELFWRQNLVASNQIRDLNLLLGNALHAAHAQYSRLTLFAVTRDVFCNYCIPTEQLAVRMVTRPSFSPLEIEGYD